MVKLNTIFVWVKSLIVYNLFGRKLTNLWHPQLPRHAGSCHIAIFLWLFLGCVLSVFVLCYLCGLLGDISSFTGWVSYNSSFPKLKKNSTFKFLLTCPEFLPEFLCAFSRPPATVILLSSNEYKYFVRKCITLYVILGLAYVFIVHNR